MGIRIPHPRKWNHKHIILVTLTGNLVVITMTAIISIILSPAHMSFSIENPKTDTTHYNFTLVAQNKSPHMAVAYGGVSADIWYSETSWVPAEVVNQRSLQDETTRQKPTNIEFSAEYWKSEQRNTPPTPKASSGGGGDQQSAPSTDETNWSNCTVLVTATVRFKYRWIISTRSYDIRANCSLVTFNTTGGDGVDCEEG